ncbi:MAG TPA: hypothetical protein VLX44_15445 [Xanthobacteraceae bacterium]|nr:hypothetical protein [Xanthobacteraceae bacterium]
MTLKTLAAAGLAALPLFTIEVFAHGPAPLLPTALVEDVKSATAGIEFMDYVGSGQVIALAPGDVLVLSYLTSCEHETITGGTVTVGLVRSEVADGRVVRAKVPCNGGEMKLSAAQASQSAATAFRVQSADIRPKLFARTPVVALPKDLARDDRTLRIVRTDRRGERHEVAIDDAVAAAGFYDLAKARLSLTRGAIYQASIGGHTLVFQVDAKATSGPAPVVSRLLRLQ